LSPRADWPRRFLSTFVAVNVSARRIRGQIGYENVATFRIEPDVNKSFTNFDFVRHRLLATSLANEATLVR
jgi:hypothetical protein